MPGKGLVHGPDPNRPLAPVGRTNLMTKKTDAAGSPFDVGRPRSAFGCFPQNLEAQPGRAMTQFIDIGIPGANAHYSVKPIVAAVVECTDGFKIFAVPPHPAHLKPSNRENDDRHSDLRSVVVDVKFQPSPDPARRFDTDELRRFVRTEAQMMVAVE